MSKNSPKNRASKPLLIGLTGGIGAGKSLVANVFKLLNVPVFDADNEAKAILGKSAEVRQKVIEAFGANAFTGNEPNRKFLAERVFSDESLRLKLNAIIHPGVGKAFENWVDQNAQEPYLLKEAAITFETGIYKQLDGVILVTAPKNVRIERVMKRDEVTEIQVLNRMAAQWSDEDKLKLSLYHVLNDGQTMIIPQVLKIHQALLDKV